MFIHFWRLILFYFRKKKSVDEITEANLWFSIALDAAYVDVLKPLGRVQFASLFQTRTVFQVLEGDVLQTVQQIRISGYVPAEVIALQHADLAGLHRYHGGDPQLAFHHQRDLPEVASALQMADLPESQCRPPPCRK